MRRKTGRAERANLGRVIVDEHGFTNVYIGGYTANPNTDVAANGYGVYWGPSHSNNVSGGTRRLKISKFKHSTHGEVHSAYLALHRAIRLTQLDKLRLNTSSQFLYDALVNGISKWKENKWLDERGRCIDNRTSWERLDRALSKNLNKRVVEFNYIAQPSDNEHQSRADQLAKSGAERIVKEALMFSVST